MYCDRLLNFTPKVEDWFGLSSPARKCSISAMRPSSGVFCAGRKVKLRCVKSKTENVETARLDRPSNRWRRGRDSNPRYPFGYAGFQDRCHQPLGHLSADTTIVPERHPSILPAQSLGRDLDSEHSRSPLISPPPDCWSQRSFRERPERVFRPGFCRRRCRPLLPVSRCRSSR